MLELSLTFLEESPAISKRKPPSQRSERQLDDTARAIAIARDAEKSNKPSRAERTAASATGSMGEDRGSQNKSHKATGGPAPTTSSKRPKQP